MNSEFKHGFHVSLVVRTYNEEQHIANLFQAVNAQTYSGPVPVIVVDSGSTDRTVALASQFSNATIVPIPKELFSYGYALNCGLEAVQTPFAISISAHCLPTDAFWLSNLLKPFTNPSTAITYGRQVGTPTSRLSEKRIFERTFPRKQAITTIYNHNGNSALRVDVWKKLRFDEKLLGLEDLDFAHRAARMGLSSVYVPDASVLHYHLETNEKVFNRYYRESTSMIHITPHQTPGRIGLAFKLMGALAGDYICALKEHRLRTVFWGVLGYRCSQYFAGYMAHYIKKGCALETFLQNKALNFLSHGTNDLKSFQDRGYLQRNSSLTQNTTPGRHS